MQLTDFHFELPTELIARYPLSKRSDSRLLQVGENLVHSRFTEIINLIQEGDLLVFNNTKVIPARLFGQKHTGGKVEIMVERILNQHNFLAQIRASKQPHEGDEIVLMHDLKEKKEIKLMVVHRHQQFVELSFVDSTCTALDMIELIGQIPLPPYMHRQAEASDKERYQTVYAQHKGSVAAPTAGFHFDDDVLRALRDKKVQMGFLTLHIGAGTFQPVRANNIKEHKMHAEFFTVDENLCQQISETQAKGKRVIAVGTTTLRALESASKHGSIKSYNGETDIFIYPGYKFHCVNALITNLHLPHSSLLMLVCAFAGYEKVMQAYAEAVTHQYRFYSYGDAMWLECSPYETSFVSSKEKNNSN